MPGCTLTWQYHRSFVRPLALMRLAIALGVRKSAGHWNEGRGGWRQRGGGGGGGRRAGDAGGPLYISCDTSGSQGRAAGMKIEPCSRLHCSVGRARTVFAHLELE